MTDSIESLGMCNSKRYVQRPKMPKLIDKIEGRRLCGHINRLDIGNVIFRYPRSGDMKDGAY